ncbi:hypothetical protein SNL152K_6638 [Streptomyces sp. NL15-2K]|nr:hypothetical protein SNL152K_6638 [Streptomyces sp. NL15-2K]
MRDALTFTGAVGGRSVADGTTGSDSEKCLAEHDGKGVREW